MQRPVQIEVPLKALSIWFISGSFLFLSGCATNSGPSQEVTNLRQQIVNLQKIQGVQNSQIEELNNKILLLKDKIDNRPENSNVSNEQPLPPTVAAPSNLAPSGSMAAGKAMQVPVGPAPGKSGPEKMYEQALQDLKKPQLTALERTVDDMLKTYKESPLTNNALFLLAKAQYDRGQFAQGAFQFERLYKTYPDGNKAVAALFQLGLCYKKMGHGGEAKEAFQNVMTVYPGSAEALAAEKELGKEGAKQQ